MSRIHIARNQRSIGQFSPEEVAERLATGDFLPTDLGWREPMESWQPLSTFTDLPQMDLSLIPPALPEEISAPVLPPTATPLEPAWERRETLGFLPALVQTISQIFSEPAATFRAMRPDGGMGAPLRYFLLIFCTTLVVAMGYSLVIFIFFPERLTEALGNKNIPTSTLVLGQIMAMVMAPVMAVLGAFVAAGIIHAVFVALSGSSRPYEATFRVWCYAVATASIFQLIPFCGGVLMIGTSLVLLVVGLREVHKIPMSVATTSVLLPALVCGGCWLGMNVFAQSLITQGLLK